jgi:glycosyltransferase involved in cell wall biosynthesis
VKVLVDDQIFVRQVRGGVSRYFVELMTYFACVPDVQLVKPWRWTRNVHALDAGIAAKLPTSLGERRAAVRLANRMRLPHATPEVVHHTYYDRSYLRLRTTGIRVVTVYDMIPELHPDVFRFGNPHDGKRELVAAADLVLCISRSTRDDLLRVYGPPAGRVVVTPLGVDRSFRPGLRPLAGLPGNYVLFVGDRKQYKDFAVLVEAFAALPSRLRDISLVAVGGGAFDEQEEELLLARRLRDRVRQVTLSDSDLPAAYANAQCFVFPSRYEGFGLPTLEAMAAGCPAVLARSSSHPEVGGDAAAYFPPGDVDALIGCLTELLDEDERRAALAAAAVQHAGRFRWEDTAVATLAAYRESLAVAPGRAS